MTDKELKRMSRSELLQMLISQMEENTRLQQQLEQAQRQLNDRTIAISEAGSIAEASMRLNGIFEAAQATAEQYLENIRRLSRSMEAAKAAAALEENELDEIR